MAGQMFVWNRTRTDFPSFEKYNKYKLICCPFLFTDCYDGEITDGGRGRDVVLWFGLFHRAWEG